MGDSLSTSQASVPSGSPSSLPMQTRLSHKQHNWMPTSSPPFTSSDRQKKEKEKHTHLRVNDDRQVGTDVCSDVDERFVNRRNVGEVNVVERGGGLDKVDDPVCREVPEKAERDVLNVGALARDDSKRRIYQQMTSSHQQCLQPRRVRQHILQRPC